MSDELEIVSKTTIKVDPKLIAEMFWAMSDDQQADFFEELAKCANASHAENKGKWYSSEFGDMQWCYLAGKLKARPLAQKMYMALSAFAFEFVPSRYEL